MVTEFISQLMGMPVETGGAHLPISSATSGAPGPLQPSSQGVGTLEPGLLEATEHYKLYLIHSNFLFIAKAIFWEAFCELIEMCFLYLILGSMMCSQADVGTC